VRCSASENDDRLSVWSFHTLHYRVSRVPIVARALMATGSVPVSGLAASSVSKERGRFKSCKPSRKQKVEHRRTGSRNSCATNTASNGVVHVHCSPVQTNCIKMFDSNSVILSQRFGSCGEKIGPRGNFTPLGQWGFR
jgi:hypothetical protein